MKHVLSPKLRAMHIKKLRFAHQRNEFGSTLYPLLDRVLFDKIVHIKKVTNRILVTTYIHKEQHTKRTAKSSDF